MNPFQSLASYEEFVYTLQTNYANVTRSTLVIIQRGKRTAWLTGEVQFASGHRLVVFELLRFDAGQVVIQQYGYEVWFESDELYWYDSQAHPNDKALASTHPHHKHIPPDIKHHRVPAPNLSFHEPNIPFLIAEIEQLEKE